MKVPIVVLLEDLSKLDISEKRQITGWLVNERDQNIEQKMLQHPWLLLNEVYYCNAWSIRKDSFPDETGTPKWDTHVPPSMQ